VCLTIRALIILNRKQRYGLTNRNIFYHLGMWWALLWAFIIGSLAATGNVTDASGGGSLLAFFVIWYFVWKAEEMRRIVLRLESRALYLESQAELNESRLRQSISLHDEESADEYIYGDDEYDENY
jgi:hypothetical protein